MKSPVISYPKFLFAEIKGFVFEWPSGILLFLSVSSACALIAKGTDLNEFEKAIFGGVVSSFLFYVFIEFLPRVSRKRARILRFTHSLQNCLDYSAHIFKMLKTEWPNTAVTIESESRFFHILGTQTIRYQPSSQGLRQIKATTNTQPIQFIYCELGDVLYGEYARLKDRVNQLDRVAAATQLEELDVESLLEIGGILDWKSSAMGAIQNLAHINNNAALFGTDLDFVHDRLLKIQTRVNTKFKVSYNEAIQAAS